MVSDARIQRIKNKKGPQKCLMVALSSWFSPLGVLQNSFAIPVFCNNFEVPLNIADRVTNAL